MNVNRKNYQTIWLSNGKTYMINQLLLPFEFSIFVADDWETTCTAIKTMIVRGAGAIGAAAGFAMAQAALTAPEQNYAEHLSLAATQIKATRPTAYNLFYSVDKVLVAANKSRSDAVKEALRLADENLDDGHRIGLSGLSLLRQEIRILTHCNAGWLAFVDWGTALAPVYKAARTGLNPFVWVGETRPRSQGARLTAWELKNEGIAHKVVADNAVATLMAKGLVDIVITGADRIALNGDTANKTGTLDRAILARHFNIPFYIAAPRSTFDPECPSGKFITIENRPAEEVTHQEGPDENGIIRKIAVINPGSEVENPSFDVTPAELITGFITSSGIIQPSLTDICRYISEPQHKEGHSLH